MRKDIKKQIGHFLNHICNDKLIQEYDEVLVLGVQDNIEKVAIVESVEAHTKDDAPYLVEKCKHVIKRMI